MIIKYDYQVSADNKTVWVHSYQDGSTVGRFGPNGIDIHNSVTDMMNGAGQCLKCTHNRTNQNDWHTFREHAKSHWGIDLPQSLITEFAND